jgi:hypothetical protein
MEARLSPKMSVITYKTLRRYHNPRDHCHENLKFHRLIATDKDCHTNYLTVTNNYHIIQLTHGER